MGGKRPRGSRVHGLDKKKKTVKLLYLRLQSLTSFKNNAIIGLRAYLSFYILSSLDSCTSTPLLVVTVEEKDAANCHAT